MCQSVEPISVACSLHTLFGIYHVAPACCAYRAVMMRTPMAQAPSKEHLLPHRQMECSLSKTLAALMGIVSQSKGSNKCSPGGNGDLRVTKP